LESVIPKLPNRPMQSLPLDGRNHIPHHQL
jgi:hypothetical protein